VVAVADGDTVEVLRDGKDVRVRLHGVDAPEIGQAFGDAAKRFTSERIDGKTVVVRLRDADRSGYLVGEILLDDPAVEGGKLSLSEMLLKEGLAWWYHQNGPADRPLALAEIDARAARRGLWKDNYPVPPWVFRNPDKLPTAGNEDVGPKPAAPSDLLGATVYVTRSGDRYHRATCRYARSATATSVRAALRNGLIRCGVCRP